MVTNRRKPEVAIDGPCRRPVTVVPKSAPSPVESRQRLFTYWRTRFVTEPFQTSLHDLLESGFAKTTVKDRLRDVSEDYRQFINFGTLRCIGTGDQNAEIKACSFNNTPWDWLDAAKQVNPEDYFLWMIARRLLGDYRRA